MAAVTIHQGSYESIPAGASPGLLFVKELLPSFDSLGKPAIPVRSFFNETTKFVTNSNDPSPVGQVLQGLVKRVERLAKLYHEVHTVYDIASEDGSRTVIFEATNVRVFKKDSEQRECKVKEVTVLELKPSADGKLEAVEVRTTMENQAITQLSTQIAHGA
ncbi:hypothetical protein BJ170DRAFT_393684 [Xylariales sp. AK1849]|nr:hypothetical protein BJ170DRAFT_393684 [Xylariales sp. AK1849]